MAFEEVDHVPSTEGLLGKGKHQVVWNPQEIPLTHHCQSPRSNLNDLMSSVPPPARAKVVAIKAKPKRHDLDLSAQEFKKSRRANP